MSFHTILCYVPSYYILLLLYSITWSDTVSNDSTSSCGIKEKSFHLNRTNILKPEIRIYDNPKTLTYEASIKTSISKDYYLTMSNIDRSDYYNIKFQKKPLMIWIWISVIMITLGGFLRLFQNAKHN